MLKFNVVRKADGTVDHIDTNLLGADLLGTPQLNKGCAFSHAERTLFQLEGLLPLSIETLDQQVARMYAQYSEHKTNLSKNIYLNVLHDYNETLFYKLISTHLEEMLPVIYTPTVGEAVERFSLQLRKTRGLYINYEERDHIDAILEKGLPDIDLMVVTDGEAVLGIGDQGIGGIKICNAKLMVYTLCAGMAPYQLFPVQLDVGTNNQRLLNDPMYLGWRHERITGQAYDDFIDKFVTAVMKKRPQLFLHWEDFGRDNARRILTRYRDKICTINGDMQSTGTVALACVLAGCNASGTPLIEHQIVIFGAGTAGVGIADQIADAMQAHGLSQEAARARIWLIDRTGLLMTDQTSLLPFQTPYAHSRIEVAAWKLQDKNFISLSNVIHHIHPTILIGCSALGGAFSEADIKTMAAHVKKPIIMPLSNPTEKSEAKPEDLLAWSEGRAIIATGSPFPEIIREEKKIRISQSNNAFAFPGIGLGAIIAKATQVSDKMLWAAANALSQCSPALQDPLAPLLPKLAHSRVVSQQVAIAVAEQARQEGLARIDDQVDLARTIKEITWEPVYYPYHKI